MSFTPAMYTITVTAFKKIHLDEFIVRSQILVYDGHKMTIPILELILKSV